MSTYVFVSSVIRRLEPIREAARHAIEGVDMRPVMAEDFVASAATPRGACLDGVRKADVFVLLLGERYGDKQASGKSATEEEYDEARQRGKHPIILRVAKSHDADQTAFLKRISQWDTGQTYKLCTTPPQVQKELTRALLALSRPAAIPEPSKECSANLAGVRPRESRGMVSHSGPWLALSWCPKDSALVLEDEQFFEDATDTIGDLFLTGKDRLLDARPTVTANDASLTFAAGDTYNPILLARVTNRGAIAIGLQIKQVARRHSNDMFFLPPAAAAQTLAGLLAFTHKTTALLDPDKAIQTGVFQLSLSQMGMMHLADPPADQSRGVTLPQMFGQQGPILVPTQPGSLLRASLSDAKAEAQKMLSKLKRSWDATQRQ